MPKVLVLCQRRDGEGTEGVHSSIEQLSRHLLGEDVDIAYLSVNTNFKGELVLKGRTDMSFVFGHNKKTDELARDYDLIISNQCPAPIMNYKRIHLHLKEGGYFAVTSYEPHGKNTSEFLRNFLTKNQALPKIKDAGFHEVDVDPKYDALLFQKEGDHTEYFKTEPYETSTYDPTDQTKETTEKRTRQTQNITQDLERRQAERDTCFNITDPQDRYQNELLRILLNGRNLADVQAQAREQVQLVEAPHTETLDDDDLYNGGKRKRTKRSNRKRRRKTRK